MSEQAILNELREIKNALKPEASYFDRDQHSLTSVVSLPTPTLESKALEEYTQYVVTTDGDIGTITYQVKSKTGASFGPELEAKDLAYIPGPVQTIKFGNDTAQSGKNINLIKYHTSRLAPPMVPPSPPGTRGDVVDPHILLGAGAPKIEKPFDVTKYTGVSEIFALNAEITTTNEWDQFEDPVGTAHGAVPSGKKMIIFLMNIIATNAGKGAGLAYGDDGVDDQAAAPTTPIQLANPRTWAHATADQTFECLGVYHIVPAGKFAHFISAAPNGTNTANAYAVEVDA